MPSIAEYIISKGVRQWRLYKVIATEDALAEDFSITLDEYLFSLKELKRMYKQLNISASYTAHDDAVILISPKGFFEVAKYSSSIRCCIEKNDVHDIYNELFLKNASIKNHIYEYIGEKT